MNALKLWFLSRLFREKVLVLAFMLLAALIWLSGAVDRLQSRMRLVRSADSELATQAIWLQNRPAIDSAAATAVSHLEPARTLDATFLVAEMQAMAGRAGLSVSIEPPRTQRSPQFAVHTVLVTSRRADLANVLRFYQELAAKAPYVGLEQVTLRIDRSAPGAVNADLQVASVELVREAEIKK
jgi:DNA-binding cell septation regulator SpoVG